MVVRCDAAERACALAQRDEAARRQEFVWLIPSCGLRRQLNDPRDEPCLLLLLNICATAVPAAALLHALRLNSHLLGATYLVANYVLFLQRLLLTLHFTEHRPLFRCTGPGRLLNCVAPYLLAPLYGVPSGAYRLHHVVMHHVEDNAAGWDLSSTERYQRDHLASFLGYWLRFALLGCIELPMYALRRRRWREAATSACSMALGWGITALAWRRCPVATLYTLVLPYAVSSLALMFGNWSQHIFIEPSSPRDDFTLTYNCLACADNSRTYNDGYHVAHHANSRTHWSELPAEFVAALDKHDARDALVFEGVGFFDVGLAVFTGRLDWLAARVVPCGPRQAARSRQDWVQLMRRRLRPCVAR